MIKEAIGYLIRGHHLIVLAGKRPHPAYHEQWSWENSIHGVPETPEEFDALDRVLLDPTVTGIGILIPQHVLVADVDTEEAAVLFAALADGMPSTVTAQTPKGLHVWFQAPGADGSRWIGGRTLLFKGFGGYVAAPPSAHFDSNGVQDGVYTWISPFEVGMDFLPARIEAELARQSELKALSPNRKGETGTHAVVNWPLIYQVANLDGLCRAIREAPDGNQNNMIAWAAMQARDEGVPFDVAMPQLLEAALQGNHPRHRAEATIRGAYKRGARD